MVNRLEERVLADDVWAVLLFPLQLLWMCFPTALRQRVLSVPWETTVLLLKIVWALMAYYWLYTLISPILVIPEPVIYWVTLVSEHVISLKESFWVWYANVRISPFSIAFPSFSILTWVATKLRSAKPQTFTEKCYNHMTNFLYVPERAIQGSDLIPTKELPSFVCFIFGVKDEAEVLVGVGFRVENAILTAAHNLTGYDKLKLMSNTAVCYVDVDTAVVHPYDDFAYFRLSDRDFSMLGLSKGKLLDHAAPRSYPVICQAYGPGTPVSFTMGAVTPVEHFGKVTYGGSTTYGFSGTPYVQNKTIVGMHLGAGMVNLGLDAAYMRMLLSIRQESTEDWLMDMIEEDQLNKRQVSWERSPGDPDEVYVLRQGKYFVMDADTFFSVYNPQAIVTESNTIKDKLPPMAYSDSKNDVMAPAQLNASAGATGKMSAIKSCVQTPLTADSYQTPMSIKTLEETLAMESQEPTPVLQSNPSGCMSKDTTYQPERNRRRPKQKAKKYTKSSPHSTNPGSPGLELIR